METKLRVWVLLEEVRLSQPSPPNQQEAQQVLNLDLFPRNHLEQAHLDRPSQLVGDQVILLVGEILSGVTEDRTE